MGTINSDYKKWLIKRSASTALRKSALTIFFLMISGQFKFYIAFENSLCDDYATEKFFNVIRELPTVPIAMGETKKW